MRNQDWSLVLFTTLSQLSVGIILCFTLLGYSGTDLGLIFAMGLSFKNPVFLALVFIGVATLISFLHLGKPSNAPGALNNLSGSWLSREILAIGVYSLSLLIVFVLGWKAGSIENLKYLLVLSSALGFALLWMMIRIYVMPTIPAWNSWYTPLNFVSTAVCLGLLTFLLLHYTGLVNIADQIIKNFAVSLIVILLIETASVFIHQLQLEKLNTGIENLVFNHGPFHKIFLFRMGILIIALLVMSVIIYRASLFPGNNDYPWMYLLFVLVITQELMGRHLFYSSYFRTGV